LLSCNIFRILWSN